VQPVLYYVINFSIFVGGSNGEYCHVMLQTDDGGCIIGGNSNSGISGEKTENSRGSYNFWLVKLNADGNKVWDKIFGGAIDDHDVWSLLQTHHKGFGSNSASDISGEKTKSSRGNFDYWVIKLDKYMNIQWDKTVGGSDYEDLFGIQEISKNHYVLGGFS